MIPLDSLVGSSLYRPIARLASALSMSDAPSAISPTGERPSRLPSRSRLPVPARLSVGRRRRPGRISASRPDDAMCPWTFAERPRAARGSPPQKSRRPLEVGLGRGSGRQTSPPRSPAGSGTRSSSNRPGVRLLAGARHHSVRPVRSAGRLGCTRGYLSGV